MPEPKRLLRTAAHTVFAASDMVRKRLPGPRILIYHQIGSGRSHEMNLPSVVFRRQMDRLQSHYDVVALGEALERRGDPAADRLVVLTFDDGYADVYRNAFPLLEERALPFTLYLTTGPIHDPDAFPSWPGEPLSWQQTRDMAASGLMTVGAHTHTHPDLRTVDEETAAGEIELSNRLIEEHLDVTPRHFAYTKGWWSSSAAPVVRRSYATATLGMGAPITADTDLYKLNRLAVNRSEPFWAWRRKLITGGRAENRVRRMLHGYRGP